jgi:hypothetical protein
MGQTGHDKKAVPCVFALLPDKEGQTYIKMWTFVKSLVTFQEGLPTAVTSDFEKGVLNTLRNVFPNISIKGCNFHQKQAIRRNIQAKGLLTLMNHSTKFNYLVKMLYGLAFVPPHKVTDIFDTIIMDYVDANKETEGFIEYAEEVEDLLAYFQRNWTGMIAGRNRTRRPPMFEISTWNKYEDVLADHKITNNICEGSVYYLSYSSFKSYITTALIVAFIGYLFRLYMYFYSNRFQLELDWNYEQEAFPLCGPGGLSKQGKLG